MDKKESFYWNIVKGTAIFLMLWGHCIQSCAMEDVIFFEDIVYKTIYSFHMPVFMLVSGYLFFYSFQKRELTDLLERRIRGMMQPIIMATVLNNIFNVILGYMLSGRVNILFGTLFHGIWIDLWFLWAVLYCSLVVGVCCKLANKPYLRLLLVELYVIHVSLLRCGVLLWYVPEKSKEAVQFHSVCGAGAVPGFVDLLRDRTLYLHYTDVQRRTGAVCKFGNRNVSLGNRICGQYMAADHSGVPAFPGSPYPCGAALSSGGFSFGKKLSADLLPVSIVAFRLSSAFVPQVCGTGGRQSVCRERCRI